KEQELLDQNKDLRRKSCKTSAVPRMRSICHGKMEGMPSRLLIRDCCNARNMIPPCKLEPECWIGPKLK
uniref:Uncharacterized protein n=1 Tax=Aegilops tauschii subsp. strangulata TaxID=200361 RepID=A0A453IU55_AEGTS